MSQRRHSFSFALCASLLAACTVAQTGVRAEEPVKPAPPTTPAPKPAPPVELTCKLDDPEVPRGGRLDVTGTKLGSSPVVRIAGKPARILERREDRISVQVAADSEGGPVTVQVDGKSAECGQLVIIGKNH